MTLLLSDLTQSEEHFLTRIQHDLYWAVDEYLKDNDMTRTAFAEKLGVSKGYISQVLNDGFDHKLSKLIELALAVGKAPVITFVGLENYEEYLNARKSVPVTDRDPENRHNPDLKPRRRKSRSS